MISPNAFVNSYDSHSANNSERATLTAEKILIFKKEDNI